MSACLSLSRRIRLGGATVCNEKRKTGYISLPLFVLYKTKYTVRYGYSADDLQNKAAFLMKKLWHFRTELLQYYNITNITIT